MAFSYLHLTEKLENFWMKSEDCVNILSQDQLDTQRYVKKNFNPFTYYQSYPFTLKKCFHWEINGRVRPNFARVGFTGSLACMAPVGSIIELYVICFRCYFLICAQQWAATYVHKHMYTRSQAPADFSGAVFTCAHFQKLA